MTAPINGTVLTKFSAYTTLEQQICYLLAHAVSLQNSYNAANPTAIQSKVAISPSFSANTVTGTFLFNIQPNTVEGALSDGVIAFLP